MTFLLNLITAAVLYGTPLLTAPAAKSSPRSRAT